MGVMGSVIKGQGAVGGLTSKVGHCGHGVRQRTSHAPGARPLQHSTSEEKIRSAGRSQGAASNCICGIISFWCMGELGMLAPPAVFAAVV